jgi:hypothetical protein
MGFHFESGIADADKVSVQVPNVRETLASTKAFTVAASKDQFIMPGINYFWRDTESGHLNVVGHHKDFSLSLKVTQVSDVLVTGRVRITGNNPTVDLAGQFRLVNAVRGP